MGCQWNDGNSCQATCVSPPCIKDDEFCLVNPSATAEATEGQPFSFRMGSYFQESIMNAQLEGVVEVFNGRFDVVQPSYELVGAPIGSGLRLDPGSLMIFGTPTEADAIAEQPLTLIVVQFIRDKVEYKVLSIDVTRSEIACQELSSCFACTTSNCQWQGGACTSQCTPNEMCFTKPDMCDTDGQGCALKSDCASGYCSAGSCFPYRKLTQSCSPFLECRPGLQCEYTCQLQKCESDGSCPAGFYCLYGACAQYALLGETCDPAVSSTIGPLLYTASISSSSTSDAEEGTLSGLTEALWHTHNLTYIM